MTVTSRRGLSRRAVRTALVLGCVAFLVLAYVRVGWWRAEAACGGDPPGRRTSSSVAYGWSWTPPGFTCAFAGGRTETSLWF